MQVLYGALLLLWTLVASATTPAVAFYYGAAAPVDELAAFDAVVLEPAHRPGPPAREGTDWFAYVSVGEADPSRAWSAALPAAWRLGTNRGFGTIVVDQSRPEWPAFFAERVVRPLWDQGWRALFLDTLDSYQLVARTPEARRAQEDGLVRVVRTLRERFPGIKLFFNRGFEILPRVHADAWGVAAESLYRKYDSSAKRYAEVPRADREWLAARLARVRDEYQLPAVAIDYVAPAERSLARDTARRIEADGFIPWVANPALDVLGVGSVEVMPRRVLVLYERGPGSEQLIQHDAHRIAAMPLNWLGYVPEYVDIGGPLPSAELAGRYAGIVTWFTEETPAAERAWPWLRRQIAAGTRVVVLGSFGFRVDRTRAEFLGLALGPWPPAGDHLSVAANDPRIGFEIAPLADRRSFQPITVRRGEPLVTVQAAGGATMHAVALTPWGGYALNPFHVRTLPGAVSKRWVVDPFAFFRDTLALPAMPVPDPTTESGRRLLIVHIDGDGFPSVAELPGGRVAGEVMLEEVLSRYHLPQTVSVIEGEIGKRGLYPDRSDRLESAARKIFALRYVEPASHSFSHPFRWRHPAPAPGARDYAYELDVPGYSYDPREEIAGSAAYIDKLLAPAGKRVRVFLWTGDCNPDEAPLVEAERAGLLNMNGGDTLITKSDPTLTSVSPLGIPRGSHFQVYAPNQNENVYTHLWQGQHYGYERVIETFELTEAPRRLKPVNIYYHAYSATKRASLGALHKVYAWALSQPLHPVYASEYIEGVLDFNRAVVARDGDGWRIRGMRTLRTVRAPQALGYATGDVVGYSDAGGERYVALASGNARLRFQAEAPSRPMLREANARVLRFDRNELSLSGHMPLEFSLQGAGCRVEQDGRLLPRGADGRYRLPSTEAHGLRIRCS